MITDINSEDRLVRDLRAAIEWLNAPERMREEVIEFPGSVDGPWARYVHERDGRGIGRVRQGAMD